ncbi:MAG: azurin [Gammaproteobacteria bacterium]|nr:MAG: azurin [Gammaproteobacteria bacterium]
MNYRSIIAISLAIFSQSAFAETCELSIEANDMMQYNQSKFEISAAKCDKVKLNLTHVGKMPAASMGHNWVLTKTADKEAIASAGIAAGAGKNYVPEGDARVLAATKVIGGGENTSVTFETAALKVGGDYSFFCSFPGHSYVMKGKFIVNQ